MANRRYLDQQLFQQLDQHSKFGTPFGIILADVDKFKNINDTYGHVAGDAALVTVRRLCPDVCVRPTYWAVGEETNSW